MPHSKASQSENPPSFRRLWSLWFNIFRDPGRRGMDADSYAYLRHLSLSPWQFGLIRGLQALFTMLPLLFIHSIPAATTSTTAFITFAAIFIFAFHTISTAIIAFIQSSIQRRH